MNWQSHGTKALWGRCVESWTAAQVPDVIVREFERTDSPSTPWIRRDGTKQVHVSNPLQTTASHLATYLVDKPLELGIAYRLHAFCRSYDLTPDYGLLAQVFAMHESVVHGWWERNSRYVLPPVHRGEYSPNARLAALQEWPQILAEAAGEWRLISEQWLIVRIPALMATDSKEWAEWNADCAQKAEAMERQEYERLKHKYES